MPSITPPGDLCRHYPSWPPQHSSQMSNGSADTDHQIQFTDQCCRFVIVAINRLWPINDFNAGRLAQLRKFRGPATVLQIDPAHARDGEHRSQGGK